MKSIIRNMVWILSVICTLATFQACMETVYYQAPTVEPEESEITEVPLLFDWSMSQHLDIQLKSDVNTRVAIYQDAAMQHLMYTTILEANKLENITITALKMQDKLYLAYLNREGETVCRTIDVARKQVSTRAVYISGDITDAAEMLPAAKGNKTIVFSPNNSVYGTILFEDMYPAMGDYDMNDFVLGYRKQYSCNETTETLTITLQVRAIGGKLPFVPGVEVMGVDVDGLDVSWTTSDDRLSVDHVSVNDASGTPVFLVNGAQNLKAKGGYFNVNQPKLPIDQLPSVTITLSRSIDNQTRLDIQDRDLNFFIYNTQTRVEIHEKNTPVTRFASNTDEKNFHMEGLVWAFRVEGYMPHTIEGQKIDRVFPKIAGWMRSSGNKYVDWITEYDPELVIEYTQETGDMGEAGQEQEPFVRIGQDVVEAPAAGGTVEIPVEANCEFDVSFGEKGWIYDFDKADGKLILYVYNNYNGSDKSATVTLTPTTDINKKFTFQLNQKTEAYTGTQIKANETFRNNMENLVIANGGTIDDVKIVNIIGHSDKYKGYAKTDLPANVYDITDGNFKDRVYMEWDAANATITVSTPGAIVSTGNTCSNMFKKCYGLEQVNLSGLDISRSNQLSSMFFDCKKLRHVDLTPLNTARVTGMNGVFTMCEGLQTVNVSGLNTANVTTMANVFDRCYSLQSVDISSWNMEKVTNMTRMFWNCRSLADVKLNGSKTSLAADGVREMFNGCYMLRTIDLSLFDFHDVLYFSSTFANCQSLQNLVFGRNNTSKIQSLDKSFTSVGGNGEFTCVNADFSSVTTMNSAFKGCTATSINLSGWKTNSVQNLGATFQGCQQATTIKLTGWTVDKVTSFGMMFGSDKAIEEIDLGTAFNLPATADLDYMFYNMTVGKTNKATLKCTRTTYDVIQRYMSTHTTYNSKPFLTQFCIFSIYE